MIETVKGACIVIGNNVTLTSRRQGNHVLLFSPTRLCADRPGAEITIGDNTRIHGSGIHAWKSVRVGNNCLIGGNTQIFDSQGHDFCFPNVHERIGSSGDAETIIIEDNVWIGTGSLVLPGVTIGKGSVIGAGSVVAKDIPSFSVAAGNPARVLRAYSLDGRET